MCKVDAALCNRSPILTEYSCEFQVIELTETTVRDIMTPLEKVFCLEVIDCALDFCCSHSVLAQIDARLDFETLGLVVEKNHSRIPVFVKDAKETIAGCIHT